MADLLGSVEKIVNLAWSIKTAVRTVRRNKEQCHGIEKLATRVSAILVQLQVRELMNSPAMSGAVEELAETLDRALEQITNCQKGNCLSRIIAAGDVAEQLRWVQTDIFNQMMIAMLASQVHVTIVVENIRSSVPCPPLSGCTTHVPTRYESQNGIFCEIEHLRLQNVSGQSTEDEVAQVENDGSHCTCLTFSIPTGYGFDIFRIFERRDTNQQVQLQHPSDSRETPENCGSWFLSCFQTVDSPKESAYMDSLKMALLSDNNKASVWSSFGTKKAEIKKSLSEFHGTASSSVTEHASSSWQSEIDLFLCAGERLPSEVPCRAALRRHEAPSASAQQDEWDLLLSDAATAKTRFTIFSLSKLEEATDNFLEDNIIGRGAFATVYRGVLHDGLVVAIKKIQYPYQLSRKHICDKLTHVSKLEHKNIVQLLGYGHGVLETTERFQDKKGSGFEDDLFLVEEYMPNGSLDNIIQGSQLDWSSRLLLIQGIAHGLHYLHEQQFVHLDLKPNNVLIDSGMNPKITDFGRARMLGQGDGATIRDTDYLLAGTMGYMPPEYIMEGIVSKMYDVYSFGVILLETISGMCGSKPTRRQSSIAWAWVAREAGRMEGLLDPSLCFESQLHEARRCLEIGLLCTQSDRADRPSMLDVVEMLDTEKELPTPKQPKYTKGRSA
ncbi:hypothetical protein GQ55_8G249700 [Panicum hallii var. hallii]|nr:hypothetical protein GQ55_8G249700 [Panicum hallii var. hallii]